MYNKIYAEYTDIIKLFVFSEFRKFNNSYTREPMEVFIEKPLPRFVPAPNDLKNAMVKNSSIALSAALGKQK